MRKLITNKLRGKSLLRLGVFVASMVGVVVAGVAFASSAETVQLTSIATTIDKSTSELAVILTDTALIAGIGFIMASFFKFHQHKLNPTQVPLSQGITLLLIGAGLTLFPSMLPTASKAVFGTAPIAQVGGAQIQGIIGKGTSS